MEYFFSTQQLAVGYDGKPLIRDIEFKLQKGRILTLIGPNGSGKSTILKTITRQLQSICGTVYINGRSIHDISGHELSRLVSVVLTERIKADRMSCEEVVETGRYPYTGTLGILSPQDKCIVENAMELTHTKELRGKDFMRISDGQRQRVLLARAIAQKTDIIVLDEPTSFLDVRYKLELLDILRNMARQQNIAVIMSLHELDLAQRISDDVACVKGETITHYGPAENIFTKELISDLYDLNNGSYNPFFGSIEMKKPTGEPQVFVIAGGGTGIAAYRRLQKQGIPFVSGVLHQNDIDYLAARDLACDVAAQKAFEPIGDEAFEKALNMLKGCKTVINCLKEYGMMNERNRELLKQAEKMGLEILNEWL